MKRIDLANPITREIEIPYSEFCYQIEEKSYLPLPDHRPNTLLSDVLDSRQSRRTYKAVSRQLLNSLLWHTARAIAVNSPKSSSRWQRRPTPSAGGRHPIDILIFTEQYNSENVYLYESLPHALARTKIVDEHSLHQFFDSVAQVVPLGQATIVWFGAQFERTLSKYENGESLVWRDAGALLATISLVAESLNLNCCAIGITGEPWLSQTLGSADKVVGAGGILIGEI